MNITAFHTSQIHSAGGALWATIRQNTLREYFQSQHKFSCNINKQTIHREAPIWIEYHIINTSYSVLATMCSIVEWTVHGTCLEVFIAIAPYDYCTLSNSTDEHCAFRHTGILCGKCQDQFSLILGISLCLPCSNLYLLLLIVWLPDANVKFLLGKHRLFSSYTFL